MATPYLARRTRRGVSRLAGLLVGLTVMLATSAAAFSGEDPVALGAFHEGGPWYHAEMSRAACLELGFAANAADTVAWHADYIDSYLYNPLWWVAGGVDRFKASLATYDELAKLHFDDLFSTAAVAAVQERIRGGAICGLMWAKDRHGGAGDISAARHLLGVSLHALQDFYSHSNWIDDPARRGALWAELARTRAGGEMTIYTGAYEHGEHLGYHHHGKIALSCTLLRNLGPLEPLMEAASSVYSPLHKSPMVEQWRACQEGEPVRPTPFGVRLPDNVLYLAPPGMALDSRWAAAVGVRIRGLEDELSGDAAFELALALAQRQSVRWLRELEAAMIANGAGDFWNRVKSAEASQREQEYEKYHRFVYQFLSAGPYPPPLDGGTPADQGFYLRVRLKTSDDTFAGTDADIYLTADGREHLLDYLPAHDTMTKRLIAFNDFETDDNTVYTVGPFPALPRSIRLENRAATAGDVLTALGEDFVRLLEGAVDTAGDILLSLIGGHADLIARNKKIWAPAELAAPARGAPATFTVELDGGDEGRYRLHGTLRRVTDPPSGSSESWADYQVRLDRLECLEESEWDRGSNSDEPFLMALLLPLGTTEVNAYRTEPFDDVDDGESREIGSTFPRVRLPVGYGNLSLALTLMEHDDESSGARDALLREFAGHLDGRTEATRQNFIDALGASVAADWKLEEIEVFAFRRNPPIQTGVVLHERANRWIEGREAAEFGLNPGGLRGFAYDFDPPAGADTRYLYAVSPEGRLTWLRHDHPAGPRDDLLRGPLPLGDGWDRYRALVAGGGEVLYGVTTDGELHWYRHGGVEQGAARAERTAPARERRPGGLSIPLPGGIELPDVNLPDLRLPPGTLPWEGPVTLAEGWHRYRHVVGGGDGVLYGITADGTVHWYRHDGWSRGGDAQTLRGPRVVATGWPTYAQVMGMGDGVVYALAPDGQLYRRRHDGWADGREGWSAPQGVARGWNPNIPFAAAGEGVFYAIQRDGTLRWLRHDVAPAGGGGATRPDLNPLPDVRLPGGIRLDPRRLPELETTATPAGEWETRELNRGWSGYTRLVALLPE